MAYRDTALRGGGEGRLTVRHMRPAMLRPLNCSKRRSYQQRPSPGPSSCVPALRGPRQPCRRPQCGSTVRGAQIRSFAGVRPRLLRVHVFRRGRGRRGGCFSGGLEACAWPVRRSGKPSAICRSARKRTLCAAFAGEAGACLGWPSRRSRAAHTGPRRARPAPLQQPAVAGEQPVPAAPCAQSGELVSLGRRGLCRSGTARSTGLAAGR